ncbi:DUF3347 domain-containing protein [Christiangramia echinicola]|uniref:DUF3347 domain-containing protein n=1 Tax=Christiangramia echinicola TaxID=279359 RepID=A0A1H1NV21_9FLAO|nr:DUF3347 domain-containing protein [Christiangramia echinicola]SDS02816.1 Protein of unknown function [Christiangramia echinicola]
MKKRLRSLITMSLVAGSLVLYSCGDNKKEQDETVTEEKHEMNESSEEMKSEEMAQTSTAEFNNEKVHKAFQQYISVKDALVQTDAEATSNAAAELQTTLQEENSEIAEIAGRLSAEKNVNVQREIFSELTAAMDPVLKGAISSGKIYKQFCPMAFEGKGDYWYATSEEIRNPYFGDKMLKCGRVDETIQ